MSYHPIDPKNIISIIPAESGYAVVRCNAYFLCSADDETLSRWAICIAREGIPIVAWAIVDTGEVRVSRNARKRTVSLIPVRSVHGSILHLEDNEAILYPDGRVMEFDDAQYDSVHHWLKDSNQWRAHVCPEEYSRMVATEESARAGNGSASDA